MKKLLLTLFFILFTFPIYAKEHLQLLMAHNPGCNICQNFINEVAVDYNDTEQSRYLPLVIINVYKQPEWFKEAYAENRIKHIKGTPTFIIWNGKKELSRLTGYRDKGDFMIRINIFIEEHKLNYEN